ncbi:hypothetical protein ERJ75_000839900 [Trypanosoma vivax]|nr:hypothetical protein ERJ75_000839900 [Trypanosoma vivax]
MEMSAERAECTLFGARETNLLSLKVGETVLKEVRTPKPLDLTMQPRKWLSKHALGVKAKADKRLTQLRTVASSEWEKLRPFCLALVQAKMCYGVASWRFDTSLSDRKRLEEIAGTGGTHSGGHSKSCQHGGCPARGAAEADRRGGTSESVGILPAIEGQRSSACEGSGQHLLTLTHELSQACEGTALVQHHWRIGKTTCCDGDAAG